MLDKKHKEIDAVTISTPDHTHFPIAMACMQMGKHVYVQKPLTHSIHEARVLTKAARYFGVKTQMGNQGHARNGVRDLCEMVWSGVIGDVRECHIWTNRPVWPQGIHRPAKMDVIPDTLNWDVWLGPMPERPFVDVHPEPKQACYLPFVWRGWWDFGCGALGDMACHIADPPNWALKLGAPTSAEVVMQHGATGESAPLGSTIKYEFPAREDMPPVTVYWYDGRTEDGPPNRPPRPEGIPEDEELGSGGNGSLFIGDKGVISANTYGDEPRLHPLSNMADYKKPAQTLRRIAGEDSYLEWIKACKGGPAAGSNFDYAGPFSEWVLLGNVALRANQRIEWDAEAMRVTNCPGANQFIELEYRKGWSMKF